MSLKPIKLNWANTYEPTPTNFNNIEGNLNYIINEDSDFNGIKTFNSEIVITGGNSSSNQGSIAFESANGFTIRAKTGSSRDFTFLTPDGSRILGVNPSSKVVDFADSISINKTITLNAIGSTSSQGSIACESANGFTIRAKTGSSRDFTLLAPDGSRIIGINPSSQVVDFADSISVNKTITLNAVGSTSENQGSIAYESVNGLTMRAKTGSSRDFTILAPDGSRILGVDDGLKRVDFTSGINVSGTMNEATPLTIANNVSITGNTNPTTTPTTGTWTTTQVIPRGQYNVNLQSTRGSVNIKQSEKTLLSISGTSEGGGCFFSDGVNTYVEITIVGMVEYWKF